MTQDPNPPTPEPTILAEIQAEVGAWHREQFPDMPLEAIRDKLQCEVREYLYARTIFLARRSLENSAALRAEAVDILLTILADLERLPSPAFENFEQALARKWAEVRERYYQERQ